MRRLALFLLLFAACGPVEPHITNEGACATWCHDGKTSTYVCGPYTCACHDRVYGWFEHEITDVCAEVIAP